MKRKSQSWVQTHASAQSPIQKIFFILVQFCLTSLHSCVLTFLYFFTFEKILSLILGSISTILLSWLKAINKMFACLVSVTWLFWLKVSSRGFALYFQDIVSGGTLLYEVFTRNSASISRNNWIGIIVGLIQQFLFLCHTLW